MTGLAPRPISIDVNLAFIAPGRVGGSEQYLARQLLGLPADAGLDVTLHCHPDFAVAHDELTARFRTRTLPLRGDRRAARIAAEHTVLARRTRSADVVHHGGGTAPLVGRRPIVLTVHDLQYLRHPDHFGAGRLAYLRRLMGPSVRRAEIVTVPSAFVKSTVIDAFGTDPARVVVVPHGVPDLDASASARADVDAVLGRFGLERGRYLLYPAITHPHKAHAVLVDMMDHLAGADRDLLLVLTGGPGRSEADVARRIDASASRDRILRPGRVDAADLAALLSGAGAMVFPSEYEGFGAPLVEAMVAGTPVVAGAADAVVEVVGPAGVVVREATGEAWANGVVDALGRRSELIELGGLRRQAFTLERSGTALADAYRRALSS